MKRGVFTGRVTLAGLWVAFLVCPFALPAPASAATGTWERAWGRDVISGGGSGAEICTVAATCQAAGTGGLGGEFNLPDAAAVDASGNVYVVEGGNLRVQKFDSSGNFLRAWGEDVVIGGTTGFEICTVAANCKPGTPGTLGGELNNPTGIGVDAAGNVYVADASNNRVQKFDSNGNFISAWGEDVATTAGRDMRSAPSRQIASSRRPAGSGAR